MNNFISILCAVLLISSSSILAQNINYTIQPTQNHNPNQAPVFGINGNGSRMQINAKVLYNAIPDGYLVTFTKTFISNSVEEVKLQLQSNAKELEKAINQTTIDASAIRHNVVALDPVFELRIKDSLNQPAGYKITDNIIFQIDDLKTFRTLMPVCFQFDIYDMIDIKAYINNSDAILDSLSDKAVQVIKRKKEICKDLGWKFAGGSIGVTNQKKVFYPNERQLRSFLQNNNFFLQDLDQNQMMTYNRRVNVDFHYNYNHRDADFVFESRESTPTIQFMYDLNYIYEKEGTAGGSTTRSDKEKKALEKKTPRLFMLDNEGNIKQIELD